MGPQELKPGDVLLFKPNGKGLYSWLMRRLVVVQFEGRGD